MSENTSILTLVWRRVVSEPKWLCLPPKLRTLHCEALEAGPPATSADGTASLPCLVSVIIEKDSAAPLHALAQLLQAAPALQDI